ncbi:stage II sporulation protein P [Anaerovorax odorimutans]|uniref:stage II sporulation protein P n=1 Tax=Anaerovorax odorimutans TaxID=109327 RepID=UPI000421C9F1|nr:stage II sporulation protein P [Anaerovorax odorimutans]
MRKGLILFCAVFILTGFFTISSFNGNSDSKKAEASNTNSESKGESIAKYCISSVFPTVSRGADEERKRMTVSNADSKDKTDENTEEDTKESSDVSIVDTQKEESPKAAKANIDYSKPAVIIYHTHATESFQPASEGNFHSLSEANTVREVGDILTAELEAKGIQVLHDKTIHDSPSYNKSYSRSLETIQNLIANNPTAKVIIDLHRDAAAYTGNAGKTIKINGKEVAKYNLVVGNGNENANNLKVFANQVNAKAEELYPGFGGRIIEKEYKYNQWVSNYYLLLEVGNNQNNISEAKLTAKYFADVLAEVIKEIK